MVVSAQGKQNIFKRSLDGQRPENAGQPAVYQFFSNGVLPENGTHDIKRRGADIAKDDTQCNQQRGEGNFGRNLAHEAKLEIHF